MTEMENEGQVLLLVGAGASVGIGIPAMKGMVRQYRDTLTNDSLPQKGLATLDQAGVESDLEEVLLEIERIDEFPNSGAYRALETKPSARRAGTADNARSVREIQRTTRALRKDILEWMSDTCLNFDRENAELIWGSLVESLRNRRTPVFTTNYDFAIEEIADDHGITVVDNFKPGRHGRRFWDHSLRSFDKEGLTIVKLHGSVDWYATQDRAEIEKLELSARRNREGIPVERVAIFPTRFKDIYETYFFSLYKKFLDALDGAQTLIVVGHSLRDEYIRAAIRECFRRPDFRLIYIGPSIPSALQNLRLADKDPSGQIRFIKGDFEMVADSLTYVLEHYPNSEVGRTLKEATDFGRKPKITFYKRVTNVDPGEHVMGDIRVLAPAIPPAELRAKLVPKTKGEISEFPIEVRAGDGGGLVTVEGIEETTVPIQFDIAQDVPDGEYKLRFTVVQPGGKLLAQKEYVCNVGNVTVDEVVPDEAPGETVDDQGQQPPGAEQIDPARQAEGGEGVP